MGWMLWAVVGFASGSVPYAAWMTQGLCHRDVREYGDGNPGAANAWRAGGWRLGTVALLLDVAKGAIPVGLARFSMDIVGSPIVVVSLAPVLGHAFSPLLHYSGGKAVAVTFGVWSALTLWFAPTVLGLALSVFYAVQSADAWSVAGAGLVLLIALLASKASPWLLVAWCGNLAILLWKHRQELRGRPALRPWLLQLFVRNRP